MSEQNHVPEGYHSVTPSLTVKSAIDALALYAKAFGAVERFRMPDPSNESRLFHAEFTIGNSTLMLSDEFPEMGAVAPEIGEGAAFMIYVPDADAAFAQAIEAGCTQIDPVEDMFWGDRLGRVADPFGYRWSLSQHVRDVSPEEIDASLKEFS